MCLAFAFIFADTIPDRAVTPTAILGTSNRIETYLNEHKELPPRLDALAESDGGKVPVDLWKRTLVYEIGPDGSFTLGSLGRDGQPGGRGEDADQLRRFRVVGWEVQPVQ